MKKARLFLLATTGVALSAMVPTFAQAQSSGASNAMDGEIIVTAQRRAESMNDVGMAIQAVDAGTLEALKVTDVRDLSAVAPSLSVSQSYQGVPTYTMRGIGFNTINISSTSTVGTYVDEVAYAYPIMNTGPVMDLERVEVLKGPQGTLYGRNTTAGLINFITAKPTDEFKGAVKAEVGNYQTYNFEGYLSGPLTEGVSARLAVRSENSDKGWQISNSRPNERQGKVDKLGIRGSLAIEPSSSTQINLGVTWWQNKSDTVSAQGIGFTPTTTPGANLTNSTGNMPGLADYLANNRPTRASQADWAPRASRSADVGIGAGLPGDLAENNRFWGLKLRLDQDLSDTVKLVSLTSYNDFKRDAISDWSGAPYEILLQSMNGRIKSFAQELHFEGETGKVNWLVGGYFARDKIFDGSRNLQGENANNRYVRQFILDRNLLLSPVLNAAGYTVDDVKTSFRTFTNNARMTTKTWSIFGSADTELTDNLKLTLGLRYTQDKQDYFGCTADFNGSMLPNVNLFTRAGAGLVDGKYPEALKINGCNTHHTDTHSFGPTAHKLDEDNVAWRTALDWSPNDDTLVYASISRGYKSGTTPVNVASKADQNNPVTQEELTSYEVGVKATLADRLLQANFAAFYYDYKDKQISTYFADPVYKALSRLDNVPKSKAYGLEGELTLRPTRGVSISANGLWLKTKIIGYEGTNAAGNSQNFDGAEFIYSPRFQGSMMVAYDVPVTSNLDLNGAVNMRYQSKSSSIFYDASLTDETRALYDVDAYASVNASIGVKSHDGWSVSLWSKNLFNKYSWSAVTSNANVVVRFANMPRTFGMTAGYSF
ncbi:TonB-dependent receptor [Sphingopyxis yananensis]|uniref:TonB-dependent receptor n=1 Tax=Sphingopyxis yananensis TaxID=2886687 RepID=UPI001D0F9C5C|nr:TonB-dependent receptor [Sphingopyxis yananensis]MCC2602208.1 TonB-dependent receptor [Sphingopyxis yananensis]